MRYMLVIVSLVMLSGCASTHPMRDKLDKDIAQMKVGMVLSMWHLSASNGLFDLYFDSMTDDAVFLGTDASERWTKGEFKSYAREPFRDGHGWTYVSRGPEVEFSENMQVAWIDEVLDHEKYGVLRGTGVLELVGDTWKIAHYSLTFLVPNDKASDVVEAIGGQE